MTCSFFLASSCCWQAHRHNTRCINVLFLFHYILMLTSSYLFLLTI